MFSDIEKGLQATFFTTDLPDLENGEWVRLLVESAGRDGDFDTEDDLRMVSYIRIGHVFRLLYDPSQTRVEVERAYTMGRHWYRIEGSQYDLIDAMVVAADKSVSDQEVAEVERLAAELEQANRQLREYAAQAEELATVHERNRLARELHDSVTQTLFTTSVLAEATPRIWEKDQDIAHHILDSGRAPHC